MRLGERGLGQWEWFEWCEWIGKLGCFWKMNGNGWNGEVKCGGSELGWLS